jgi:dihydropteroate synthase
MLGEGATFLDVGGYSSRPGAEDIAEEIEIKRVVETISAIISEYPNAILSVDTFRHKVAESALMAGAALVNDISAGRLDVNMIDFVVANEVPYIAMHMRGNPKNMTSKNYYDDLLKDIVKYFSKLIEELTLRGHVDLIIDPGFGFAKDIDQNFELLNKLDYFRILNKPLLVGLSRKSMISKTLQIEPKDALNGTTVINTLALSKGADILRVHDVKAAVEAVILTGKMSN